MVEGGRVVALNDAFSHAVNISTHVRYNSFFRISKSRFGCRGFAGPARGPGKKISSVPAGYSFREFCPENAKVPEDRDFERDLLRLDVYISGGSVCQAKVKKHLLYWHVNVLISIDMAMHGGVDEAETGVIGCGGGRSGTGVAIPVNQATCVLSHEKI